jgi:perosamine synthetase
VSTHGRWVKSFGGWPSSWGVKYANATTGGITALHTALGVGPGNEVITTPFTFAALAAAILHADAVPTSADIDRKTLNLDSASVESKITDTTKAVAVSTLPAILPRWTPS